MFTEQVKGSQTSKKDNIKVITKDQTLETFSLLYETY